MSFVDQLLKKHHGKFTTSFTHPLTNELCAGSLSDTALFVYLVQDLKFFLLGLRVLGKAVALCDSGVALVTLGKQIGFLCNDENDYFRKSISNIKSENYKQLQEECPLMLRDAPTLTEVQTYLDLLNWISANCNSYVEVITFIYVLEKVYLAWAEYNLSNGVVKEDLAFKHVEWIRLHSGTDFTAWVKFLENEMNRVIVSDEDKACSEAIFVKAINLEIDFFDACYSYKEN